MGGPATDLAQPRSADLAPVADLAKPSQPDLARPFTLTVGGSTDVASATTRSAQGFKYGYSDGVMGAVMSGTQYLMFGSANSNGTSCTTGTSKLAPTPSTQGIYTFLSSGSDPTQIGAARCAALLSPEGGVFDGGTDGPFDRNYLGGGPVMRVTSADGTRAGILTVFHSEFQWGPTCASAPCFYGTLGMGISTDDGNSMQRLGQIIQPNPARADWIGLDPTSPQSLSIGNGPFVLGDIDAIPVDPRSADPTQTYFYVFYPDYTIVNGHSNPGLAVARALFSDLIAAAFAGDSAAFPTLFHKYYNPSGTLAARDAFTEPGVSADVTNNDQASGRFTPVLTKAFSPSVLYDATLGQVILASTTTNSATVRIIELRSSNNLLNWGAAAVTIDESAAGMEVRYPSLIGDQPNPSAGGAAPYLFYSHEPVSTPTWPNTTLVVRRLSITFN
jgi:hypothetical protein